MVWSKGEGVKDCRAKFDLVLDQAWGAHEHDLHITGNSRISINPPSATPTRLSLEDTELVES